MSSTRTVGPSSTRTRLVALKPQDVVIPENTARDLVRVASFVDDELETRLRTSRFYNVKTIDDLRGKVVVGLAPHTSVGVAARVIGFSNAQVCFANPCWHSAKRRDCDGDGDSVLLLLDIFLNFSVEYIPTQIGGLMDTPLLIQPIILPAEVDDQAHNFDVAWKYPLAFYEATESSPNASKVSGLIETIRNRVNPQDQFYNYGFTHSTSSITIKSPRSAYSTLNTLSDKISKQIEVAEKIEAVSAKQVVESIIKTHLIRDIMGNMKKYSTQSFKCRACSRTLRRPTVSARCENLWRGARGRRSPGALSRSTWQSRGGSRTTTTWTSTSRRDSTCSSGRWTSSSRPGRRARSPSSPTSAAKTPSPAWSLSDRPNGRSRPVNCRTSTSLSGEACASRAPAS